MALSVQTAVFDDTKLQAIFELTGWILLFFSGTIGLYLLDQIPKNYKLSIHMQGFKRNINEALKILNEDNSLPPDKKSTIKEFIDDHKNGFNTFESQKSALQKKLSKLYFIHKHGLLLGLFFILLSRGLSPIRSIIGIE